MPPRLFLGNLALQQPRQVVLLSTKPSRTAITFVRAHFFLAIGLALAGLLDQGLYLNNVDWTQTQTLHCTHTASRLRVILQFR
jgi:hypothetical protein